MISDQPDWIWPDGSDGKRDELARCIVSVGLGRHYRERLRSTVNHCAVHCPETWRLFYDVLPEGSPTHQEMPYAFKIHALKRPVDAGFRFVLWMDTSFQPVASIEPLWDWIKGRGWFVPIQGDSKLGSWTSDAALKIFGISRDEAMRIPLVYSGLVGLDLSTHIGKAIWREWKTLMEKGAFVGPHYNREAGEAGHKWAGPCSDDPRCEGHRHDESALSFMLYRLGLAPVNSGFLEVENESHIIGHRVPDYDVVRMREATIDLCGVLACTNRESADHLRKTLCR